MKARSNEEWVELLSQTETTAQAELYTELGNYLHRVVCSYINARSANLAGLAPFSQVEQAALAHDCVQQALIAIHQNLVQYRGNGAFLNWAVTIVVRKTGEELRRAHWQTPRYNPTVSISIKDNAFGPQSLTNASGMGQPPDAEALTTEMWYEITWVVQRDLSEQQRRAFLARFVDDMTNAEIAAAEGVTPSVIYQRIHQARLKIKRRLEAAGYEIP